MNAPRNDFEARKRAEKVRRFVAAFNETVLATGADPATPEVAATVLQQLSTATEEQWAKLAVELGERKTPSRTSREAIITVYATLSNKRYAKGDHDEQEPGKERFWIDGDVNGREYRVIAVNYRGAGFDWELYLAPPGEKADHSNRTHFVRSGYTRGVDVLAAFHAARELAETVLSSRDAAAAVSHA